MLLSPELATVLAVAWVLTIAVSYLIGMGHGDAAAADDDPQLEDVNGDGQFNVGDAQALFANGIEAGDSDGTEA